MRANEVAFTGALCRQFPVFMPMLQEHLDDYDGLLPHVLMADVTRWIVQRFKADPADAVLRQVIDYLETAFQEDSGEDRELIAASFLENLPRPEETGAEIRALLGPALQEQLRLIG
jgi:hypothetical protein